MGFAKGQIILDSPTGTYFPGQNVNGKLVFDLKKPKTIRGIELSVKGVCNVSWWTLESTENTVHRRDHYGGEDYIMLKWYLVGSKTAERYLEPGKFEYPFSFQLPLNCQSSMEGKVGYVRYKLKAVMDIPFALDKVVTREFQVQASFDLNTIDCKEPGVLEVGQTYGFWCCISGPSQTLLRIPKRGFCCSEPIPVELICNNRSSVEIEDISIIIKKELTFHASTTSETKEESVTVVEIKKGPVPPRCERSWQLQINVPQEHVHILPNCPYIDVEYYIVVRISPGGLHLDQHDRCQIYFGTTPLTYFETDVPNQKNPALTNMLPQNYPPVAYPHPNSSPQNSQNCCPYPVPQNTPYSEPSSQSTVSYDKSYPAPYLISNSPYPANNPPYPGNTPPYPDNTPPYPGNTPPYPIEDKRGIKSFNMADSNEERIPLMPSMPYPKNGNKPYNPEFVTDKKITDV